MYENFLFKTSCFNLKIIKFEKKINKKKEILFLIIVFLFLLKNSNIKVIINITQMDWRSSISKLVGMPQSQL